MWYHSRHDRPACQPFLQNLLALLDPIAFTGESDFYLWSFSAQRAHQTLHEIDPHHLIKIRIMISAFKEKMLSLIDIVREVSFEIFYHARKYIDHRSVCIVDQVSLTMCILDLASNLPENSLYNPWQILWHHQSQRMTIQLF